MGQYSGAGAGACSDCGAGSFSSAASSICSPCQPGFVSGAQAAFCTSCLPGQRSGSGASACVSCGVGKASDNYGASECRTCDSGSIADGTGFTACSICAAGRFASPGSTVCAECAVGRASENSGAGECRSCTFGTFANTTALTACSSCSAGRYAGFGASACTECGAGKFSENPGADDCRSCSSGTFANATGLSICASCSAGRFAGYGASICVDCGVGKANENPGSGECRSCSAGSFANTTGLSGCYSCSAGRFAAGSGASTCDACPSGTFAFTAGAAACQPCSPGASSQGRAGGASRCELCAPGYYSGSYAAASCSPCPPGKYAPDTGLTACVWAAAGTYQGGVGAVNTSACPAGRYGTAVGADSVTQCTSCEAGRWSAAGTSACSACASGTFSASVGGTSAANCTQCSAGWYQPSVGATRCIACAGGFHTGGLTQAAACEPCPAGSGTDMLGAPSAAYCLPVPMGRYGELPGMPRSSAVACPPGRYGTREGATSMMDCAACRPGTKSSESGAAFCTACATGRWQSGNASTDCFACSRGRYGVGTGAVSGGDCVLCPAGFSTPADAATSTSDCTVDLTRGCAAGFQFVLTRLATNASAAAAAGAGANSSSAGGGGNCSLLSVSNSSVPANGSCPTVDTAAQDGSVIPWSSGWQSRCERCSPGWFSIDRAASCSPCPAGRYQPPSDSLRDDASCLLCPDNTHSATLNATTAAACYPCPLGSLALADRSACAGCPADTVMHADASTGVRTCVACGPSAGTAGGGAVSICPVGVTAAFPAPAALALRLGPWVGVVKGLLQGSAPLPGRTAGAAGGVRRLTADAGVRAVQGQSDAVMLPGQQMPSSAQLSARGLAPAAQGPPVEVASLVVGTTRLRLLLAASGPDVQLWNGSAAMVAAAAQQSAAAASVQTAAPSSAAGAVAAFVTWPAALAISVLIAAAIPLACTLLPNAARVLEWLRFVDLFAMDRPVRDGTPVYKWSSLIGVRMTLAYCFAAAAAVMVVALSWSYSNVMVSSMLRPLPSAYNWTAVAAPATAYVAFVADASEPCSTVRFSGSMLAGANNASATAGGLVGSVDVTVVPLTVTDAAAAQSGGATGRGGLTACLLQVRADRLSGISTGGALFSMTLQLPRTAQLLQLAAEGAPTPHSLAAGLETAVMSGAPVSATSGGVLQAVSASITLLPVSESDAVADAMSGGMMVVQQAVSATESPSLAFVAADAGVQLSLAALPAQQVVVIAVTQRMPVAQMLSSLVGLVSGLVAVFRLLFVGVSSLRKHGDETIDGSTDGGALPVARLKSKKEALGSGGASSRFGDPVSMRSNPLSQHLPRGAKSRVKSLRLGMYSTQAAGAAGARPRSGSAGKRSPEGTPTAAGSASSLTFFAPHCESKAQPSVVPGDAGRGSAVAGGALSPLRPLSLSGTSVVPSRAPRSLSARSFQPAPALARGASHQSLVAPSAAALGTGTEGGPASS